MQTNQADREKSFPCPRVVLENSARRVFLSADGQVAAVENSGLGHQGVTVVAVASGEVLLQTDDFNLAGLSADGERVYVEGNAAAAFPFFEVTRAGKRAKLFLVNGRNVDGRLDYHTEDSECTPSGRYFHLHLQLNGRTFRKFLFDARNGSWVDLPSTDGWTAFAADDSFVLVNDTDLTRYDLSEPGPSAAGKLGVLGSLRRLFAWLPLSGPKKIRPRQRWSSKFPGAGGDVVLSPDGRFALTAGYRRT